MNYISRIIFALLAFSYSASILANPNLLKAAKKGLWDDVKRILETEEDADVYYAPPGSPNTMFYIERAERWDLIELVAEPPRKRNRPLIEVVPPGAPEAANPQRVILPRRVILKFGPTTLRLNFHKVLPSREEPKNPNRSKRPRSPVNYFEGDESDFAALLSPKVDRLGDEIQAFYQHGSVEVGYQLMEEALLHNRIDDAVQICIKLYEVVTTHKLEIRRLMERFQSVFRLGEDKLGRESWAWILYVLAWHMEIGDIPIPQGQRVSVIEEYYRQAASRGCIPARYNLATLLTRRERHEEAFSEWTQFRRESPEAWQAAADLGAFHELGLVGPADLSTASALYQEGCDHGCALSALKLAGLLERGPIASMAERQRVMELYKRAGEGGMDDAWYNLGVIHLHGWTGIKNAQTPNGYDAALINFDEAEVAFRKAYELDQRDPTNPMAVAEVILDNARKLNEARIAEAMALLETAIQLGSHEAAYRRGFEYMNGRHVPQRIDLAIRDFETLDRMNETYESTHVDGLFLLAKLMFDQPKGPDRLEVLDRVILIAKRASIFSSEYPDWRNPSKRQDIHQARGAADVLWCSAEGERADLLLKQAQAEQNKRAKKRLLIKSLMSVQTSHKHFINSTSILKLHRAILIDLIDLNLNFVVEPAQAAATPFCGATPCERRVAFIEEPEVIKIEFVHEEGLPLRKAGKPTSAVEASLAEARRLYKELTQDLKGVLPQELQIKFARALVNESTRLAGNTELSMELLRQARDILQELIKTNPQGEVKAQLKRTYIELAHGYDAKGKLEQDAQKRNEFIGRANFYRYEAHRFGA